MSMPTATGLTSGGHVPWRHVAHDDIFEVIAAGVLKICGVGSVGFDFAEA
jgi:hypothetical protein